MIKSRYIDLTKAEIRKAAQLTAEEKRAVDHFLSAARDLPDSFFLQLRPTRMGTVMEIHKRVTRCLSKRVATCRKTSMFIPGS